jgi:hypothetical protein
MRQNVGSSASSHTLIWHKRKADLQPIEKQETSRGAFFLIRAVFRLWLFGFTVKRKSVNVNLYKKTIYNVFCLFFYVSLHDKPVERHCKRKNAD